MKIVLLFISTFVIFKFLSVVRYFYHIKKSKLILQKRDLSSTQRRHLYLIYSLTALHFVDCLLDLAYPLLSFIDDDPLELVLKEYICFMLIPILDLVSALGFLYLFFRMGLHTMKKAERGIHKRGGFFTEDTSKNQMGKMGTQSVQALL